MQRRKARMSRSTLGMKCDSGGPTQNSSIHLVPWQRHWAADTPAMTLSSAVLPISIFLLLFFFTLLLCLPVILFSIFSCKSFLDDIINKLRLLSNQQTTKDINVQDYTWSSLVRIKCVVQVRLRVWQIHKFSMRNDPHLTGYFQRKKIELIRGSFMISLVRPSVECVPKPAL